MSILAQTFLTFVRRHLMSLPFLTAWHNSKSLTKLFLNYVHKYLCRFERRDIVSRNSHSRILGDVSCGFFGSVLDDEAAETKQINCIAL